MLDRIVNLFYSYYSDFIRKSEDKILIIDYHFKELNISIIILWFEFLAGHFRSSLLLYSIVSSAALLTNNFKRFSKIFSIKKDKQKSPAKA